MTKRGLIVLLTTLSAISASAGPNEEGKLFLKENSMKDGVISLPSGLQYKVLRRGDGEFHPTVDSTCSCHYEGRLIDGTVFDSSYARGSPTDFAPNQVIKGWTEAMQLMVEGDKWEMYIPSDLAYGDRGSPPKIGGGDTLVFTMEIIEIKGNKVKANRCDFETKEGCDEKELRYIQKLSQNIEKDSTWLEKMIARLSRMQASGSMSEKNLSWLNKRLAILRQVTASSSEL